MNELPYRPPFIDNMRRKPNKASLVQSLFGKDHQLIKQSDIIATDINVVGGVLLRKAIWKQGVTFIHVVDSYNN